MKKKIIVVNDSQVVRQQVALALGAGFEVIEGEDGIDALQKLCCHPDAVLIICNANMPRINGLGLIEAVRRNPAHHLLPLLVLSAEGQADWIGHAVKAGAKAWMGRPFKPELVLRAAKKLAAQGQGGLIRGVELPQREHRKWTARLRPLRVRAELLAGDHRFTLTLALSTDFVIVEAPAGVNGLEKLQPTPHAVPSRR